MAPNPRALEGRTGAFIGKESVHVADDGATARDESAAVASVGVSGCHGCAFVEDKYAIVVEDWPTVAVDGVFVAKVAWLARKEYANERDGLAIARAKYATVGDERALVGRPIASVGHECAKEGDEYARASDECAHRGDERATAHDETTAAG